ncbi:MAG TPA: AraC family transcriptional regulator [Kofleriaceae bacterium]|nr:AraC family transcriptional regulator [Kofleriaceae bacterium]
MVLSETDLECAGPVSRTTPRPPDVAERVAIRWRADIPGVEHWRVEASSRLWTLYHERYTFCVANSSPGPQAWRYRRRTYRMYERTTAMLIAPGEVHVTTEIPLASFQVVMIDPAVVQRELGDAMPDAARNFSGGQVDHPIVAQRFTSLCRVIEDREADGLERRALLRQFLLAAVCAEHDQPDRTLVAGCERAVMQVREMIHSCLHENFTLEHFEQVTNVSRYHLERSFHAKVGVPIHRYLKLVRLERAQALLRSGRSATEAAHHTGFFDSAHLSRAFKAELGITPGSYARSWTARISVCTA